MTRKKQRNHSKKKKPLLNDLEQRNYIEGKIGKPVTFRYPESSSNLVGKLIDRFTTKVSENKDVIYWFVTDLIHFDGQKEDWIRMTYYRYRKPAPIRRWTFAGQTSMSGPRSQMKRFFVGAMWGKPWIRSFFEDIFNQFPDFSDLFRVISKLCNDRGCCYRVHGVLSQFEQPTKNRPRKEEARQKIMHQRRGDTHEVGRNAS